MVCSSARLDRRSVVMWTLGHAMLLVGVILMLYIGGWYAQISYLRYAARGDTNVPLPDAVFVSQAPANESLSFVRPARALNQKNDEVGEHAAAPKRAPRSTITRIVIPRIAVDAKVVEVGWEIKQQGARQIEVWQVAEYAVGHHRGSANPGEGDNIVLAGHVGGYGMVFKDLFYLKPGDQLVLYSAGQQYLYVVQEHVVVTEEGVPLEQRVANARYIASMGQEVVTLVTCWPASGPAKFTQRVIVRAYPFVSRSFEQGQLYRQIR